ncbi:MarR family winged helix-turn-helix transcriptional regulator [Konateibacter massiliensis]|uniref:MarR family winged helix-turn-helix transcriptional regulator n=1 Tax=Konateibacter massiliensis TaxID=2002841 RepID=UPI000C1536F1|nr:MarR family transcriptional regulator [Konateibacter massiliensis]
MNIETKQYLFGSIFLLSNKLQTLGDNYLQEITLKQWFLMMMIHNLDKEQPSVTEVAAYISSTRQNVRKMLDVLASKGYVELTVNAQDKRNLSVALTPKAYQFFTQFEEKGDVFLQTLFGGIDTKLLENCRQTFEMLFENMERMEHINEENRSNL